MSEAKNPLGSFIWYDQMSNDLPGYIRISFETERPPIFCGDRARGAS